MSDAGAPAVENEILYVLNPLRFKRVADITFNQYRALRSETSFISSRQIRRAAAWLNAKESGSAAAYSTSLSRMSEASFDFLARHGCETARWNDALFLNGWNAALAWT